MAISDIGICNISIGKLGGNPIMTLDDGTTESDLCKYNYATSRDSALSAVDWTFARKRATLVPMTGSGGEVVGNDYEYRFKLPSDCLTLRHVSADGSFEDRLAWEKEQNTLLANVASLTIKYTFRVTDTNLFSPGFIPMAATQLAADICVTLTASTTRETALQNRLSQMADGVCGADGVQSLPERQQANRITDARFRYV